MSSKTIANGILRAVATIVLVGLGLYFLYLIQSVIIYLVVAFILTLIGNPILDFFKQKLKFNHIFATVATLSVYFLIIIGLLLLFVPLIMTQGESLSLLNTTEIEKNIVQLFDKIAIYLDSHNIDSKKVFKEANIGSKLDFSFIPNLFNHIINALSSFGVGLASVLFITFFFLKDRINFIIAAKQLSIK